MKNKRLNRRTFIQKSAAGVGGLVLAPTLLPSASNWRGANDRIHMGHIGLGQRGTNELKNYFLPLEGSRSVAICDVFRERRQKGVELTIGFYKEKGISAPECKAYLDFEEILDRTDIDAVHITTPDHWHVPCCYQGSQGRQTSYAGQTPWIKLSELPGTEERTQRSRCRASTMPLSSAP